MNLNAEDFLNDEQAKLISDKIFNKIMGEIDKTDFSFVVNELKNNIVNFMAEDYDWIWENVALDKIGKPIGKKIQNVILEGFK